MIIETARVRLVLESTEAVLAQIEAMSPADRAAVSPDWLARLRGAAMSPWQVERPGRICRPAPRS